MHYPVFLDFSACQSARAPRRPVSEARDDAECETGSGRFQQQVVAGPHRFLADEPVEIGEDTGPTPYDLLLAGLGACTSMTLRMYAERKGWALDSVVVRLHHGRVHADDCADCESAPAMIESIHRAIDLRGALTDEQRGRLLDLADRCPVHRTLESDIQIVTKLIDPAR